MNEINLIAKTIINLIPIIVTLFFIYIILNYLNEKRFGFDYIKGYALEIRHKRDPDYINWLRDDLISILLSNIRISVEEIIRELNYIYMEND